ncbi:MAG: type I polyketide synthase, partial [Myxococcales bacterium]|nr:type I polyketide synthase [Myxococcales bacterium]
MSEDQLRLYRTRLREATAAIEALRGKLAAEQGRREPLAIVGMGCRFPQADGPEAFWTALARGVDGVREIPGSRWPRDAIPGDRPEVRWAGLLDAVDGFDAAFFGVSPREAERLDPQQRLLLEVAWEALEDAGARATELAGAQVGVFAGLNSLDHQHRMMRRGLADVDAYTATGNLLSTASGRISYSFGFEGPCVAIDTACSSSLVAVALACQSLRAGECEVALAGGVTLLLSPYMMALAAGTQALAPDGRCKVLDARANGFVRGEGCGMVVLKRLADARRDGDLVRAVIRGWAVNQDGRSTGLTAPNVRSQAALLRTALTRAEVAADEVGYVEMHGTGTPLGDPIETEALRAVFPARADGSRCVLGAVKSNVGHLEAAAGVAGLIKTVLALERGEIPRNLHFRRINPRVTLAGSALAIASEAVAWRRGGRRRIAGVSSFGISGTNAHVVVEEGPELAGTEGAPEGDAGPALIVLSARSEGALAAGAGRLRGLVMHERLADLAVSLATTRSSLEHRLAIVAESGAELDAMLAAAERGELPGGATRATAGRGPLALLFTGQGAQAPGMGQELYAAWPAFRAGFDACAELFDAALPRALRSVMWAAPGSAEAGLLDETMYTQAALFTLEVALAGLWRSWGVVPDLVAGHSIGEVAAAQVAGVLSLA